MLKLPPLLRSALAALLSLAVLPGCASPVPHGGVGPAPATEPAGLAGLASRMLVAAPHVARVWPGFWSADPVFVLIGPPDSVLLVSPRTPPPGYTRLSGPGVSMELSGRVYHHAGFPPGLGLNRFVLNYAVGGDTVPALEAKGSNPFQKLDFYFHEAFHGFQARRFAPSPEGDRRVRFRERLVDSAQIAGPEFAAAGEVERRVLTAALDASDADSLRSLVRAYLALRERRTGSLPQVRAVERSFERLEGTAQFVGCSAAAAATGPAPAERATACVREELTKPLSSFDDFPEADARLVRWRHYGTGAAMAVLLERLGTEWRPAVQGGAYLDVLLAERTGFDPAQAEPLARSARARFGPAPQLEP